MSEHAHVPGAIPAGPPAWELRGRSLRCVLVMMLYEHRRRGERGITVAELAARCHDEGLVFTERPSKLISDALRREMALGRAVRVRRGHYGFGYAPRSTLTFIRRRAEEGRRRAATRPHD